MNLKLRFALLFTSFVALILALCCATIYILFETYREEDYYDRVRIEGTEVYKIFNSFPRSGTRITNQLIREVHDKALNHEALFITDSLGKVLFRMPDSSRMPLPKPPSGLRPRAGFWRYTDAEGNQHVVMRMAEKNEWVYISGYDQFGIRKRISLQLILAGVFLGGLFLTAIMSFLFVNEAIKPLRLLSLQMKRTTELNLGERIPQRNTGDELEAIAGNFNAMLERLRRAFDFQKSFARHAAHELRTPLAVMLSQTEAALAQELGPEQAKQVLLSLKEDQQQLIDLTHSLLVLSQAEKTQVQPEWPAVRIDELMMDVMAKAQKALPGFNMELDYAFSHPEQAAEPSILGNEMLLRIAFENLIKNAQKYATAPWLRIKLVEQDHAWELTFCNPGLAMNEEEVEQIFHPFFRASHPVHIKGFGLGLSMIKRIAEAHSGQIAYHFQNASEHVFTLRFPKRA